MGSKVDDNKGDIRLCVFRKTGYGSTVGLDVTGLVAALCGMDL